MIGLGIKITGDIRGLMRGEIKSAEEAVTSAMGTAGTIGKTAWRAQIVQAGLGVRLGNTIRSKVYPQNQPSINAAAVIDTNAPTIVSAHNDGATIVAVRRRWLAIPLPAAGKARGGAKLTPATWQFNTGRKLVFVPGKRPNTATLRTTEGVGLSRAGVARPIKRRRNSRTGVLSGEASITVFALVRQVRLPKRLNVAAVADQAASGIATNIVRRWK